MKHSPLIASACLALVLMSSSLIGSTEARNKKKYVGETGGDFEFIDEVSSKWLYGYPAIHPGPHSFTVSASQRLGFPVWVSDSSPPPSLPLFLSVSYLIRLKLTADICQSSEAQVCGMHREKLINSILMSTDIRYFKGLSYLVTNIAPFSESI